MVATGDVELELVYGEGVFYFHMNGVGFLEMIQFTLRDLGQGFH